MSEDPVAREALLVATRALERVDQHVRQCLESNADAATERRENAAATQSSIRRLHERMDEYFRAMTENHRANKVLLVTSLIAAASAVASPLLAHFLK